MSSGTRVQASCFRSHPAGQRGDSCGKTTLKRMKHCEMIVTRIGHSHTVRVTFEAGLGLWQFLWNLKYDTLSTHVSHTKSVMILTANESMQ